MYPNNVGNNQVSQPTTHKNPHALLSIYPSIAGIRLSALLFVPFFLSFDRFSPSLTPPCNLFFWWGGNV
ncbi:unnamed protein product [Periconia digitata]|uniref:Uncharacterized protein n=1 Tax=Periconia digitata TaxID=1303443 RepID=A0A9W4ULV5_9PLEO|nr:unnamed protein product [Periconia digitata]